MDLMTLITALLVCAPIASVGLPGPDISRDPSPYRIAGLDFEAARRQDAQRDAEGLPPRYALREDVRISPDSDGHWERDTSGQKIWRLQIQSPGSLSLNLGFSEYRLPVGGRLSLLPVGSTGAVPIIFDHRDNKPHRQLWTPVILADEIVVELSLPDSAADDFDLLLTAINSGYRYFGEEILDKSGSCNIDVVCPEGDDWRLEIDAVGLMSMGGVAICTGTMLNNTSGDLTPYFMTANHCNVDLGNAASLVIYWNFQSPTCGLQGGGSLADFQSGSTFLAGSTSSDFTLLLLDDPPDVDHHVSYAGWERSDVAPLVGTTIHHPSKDEKSISFEYDPPAISSYGDYGSPGDGSHIRIDDWDLGTTESGSSGGPLFDQNHRFVGQLHGGFAGCDNDYSDWFGRFAAIWPYIAAYLDPGDTGALRTDGYRPPPHGMKVRPDSSFAALGPFGGPFTPAGRDYYLVNLGSTPIDYQVQSDADWLDISVSGGTLAPGDSLWVGVTVNASADGLGTDTYTGVLSWTNLSDGDGDIDIPISLQVGLPEVIYAFDMDTDPGWSTDPMWQHGTPLGGGGVHGYPDPTAGYTGTQVYGYDLSGDYAPNIPQRHLISEALDCANLIDVNLSFRRWLGVEAAPYDNAAFSLSTNGVDWTPLWQNSDEVADNAWQLMEFDISDLADLQPQVYLRWTMGASDGGWEYCGWNLDDVEIRAVVDLHSAVDIPDRTALRLSNHPNPFNPSTRIDFTLAVDGPITLDVFDPRGRRVRRLIDGYRRSGARHAIWDGRGDNGRLLGSGTYYARLRSGGHSAGLKMLLLK